MRSALSGLLLFTASTLACAGDTDAEARLSWQLSFGGGQGMQNNYALDLGYTEDGIARPENPRIELASVRVTEQATVASLAGVPIQGPGAASQLDDIAYSSSPIYWVWWAATGAVIAVWAIDQANDDDGAAPAGSGGGG